MLNKKREKISKKYLIIFKQVFKVLIKENYSIGCERQLNTHKKYPEKKLPSWLEITYLGTQC